MVAYVPEVPSDTKIIRNVLSGNTEDFSYLMDRYQNYVLAIVKKHVPRQQIEEIVQEIFVRAYQSLGNFRETGGFKQWLSSIAMRTCYDYWRKRYRHKEIPMSFFSREQIKWLESAISLKVEAEQEEMARRQEARQLLNQVLGYLSAEDRIVLELVHLEGLSVKETAELLGWSAANIKVRAFRSRKKLQKILNSIRRN